MIKYVIKRDGRKKEYNGEFIKQAIKNAYVDVYKNEDKFKEEYNFLQPMIENELDLTSDELRRKYCKYDASWMIYKNKPKYEFICEAENLSIKIHIRLAKIFAMLTLLGAYPPFSLSISSPD